MEHTTTSGSAKQHLFTLKLGLGYAWPLQQPFAFAMMGASCVLPAFAAKNNLSAPDPAIAPIQDQIATLDGPGGYYSTTYRKDETLYWANLPGWMRRDAERHKVERVLDIGCGYGTLLAFAAEVYRGANYCIDVTHTISLAVRRNPGLPLYRRVYSTGSSPGTRIV